MLNSKNASLETKLNDVTNKLLEIQSRIPSVEEFAKGKKKSEDLSSSDDDELSKLGSAGIKKREPLVTHLTHMLNCGDDFTNMPKFLRFYQDLKMSMSNLGYEGEFKEFESHSYDEDKTTVASLILRELFIGPFMEKANANVKIKLRKSFTKRNTITRNGFKILDELFRIYVGEYNDYFLAPELVEQIKFGENYNSVDGVKNTLENLKVLSNLYDTDPVKEETIVTTIIKNIKPSLAKELVEWHNKDDKRKAKIEYTTMKLKNEITDLQTFYELYDGYVSDKRKKTSFSNGHAVKEIRIDDDIHEIIGSSKPSTTNNSSANRSTTNNANNSTNQRKNVNALHIANDDDSVIRLDTLKLTNARDISARPW